MASLNLPSAVVLKEVGPRDGFQAEAEFIDTERKLEIINGLVEAGFKRIEVTMFAHPRFVQFRDAEEVLKRLERRPGVDYYVGTINIRALERAIEAKQRGYGPDVVMFGHSAWETHNLRNLNQTLEESIAMLRQQVKMAREAGLRYMGGLIAAFGCPYDGRGPVQQVIDLLSRQREMGIDTFVMGDHTGEADPKQVYEWFCLLRDRFPDCTFVAHFHDVRGQGLACVLAALQAGVTHFDSSLGGMGGQPAQFTGAHRYVRGHGGNVCTEDLVNMLELMGIRTGIDLDRLIQLGRRLEEVVGRPLESRVVRAGRTRPEGYPELERPAKRKEA